MAVAVWVDVVGRQRPSSGLSVACIHSPGAFEDPLVVDPVMVLSPIS